MRIALAMKPGESADCVTAAHERQRVLAGAWRGWGQSARAHSLLLHASPNARARASVSSEVCSAGMSSTSFLGVCQLPVLTSLLSLHVCEAAPPLALTSAARG